MKEQKPRWEINNPHTTKWTKEMIDEKFEELVEQKPAQTEEEREYVKTLKGLVSDFVRDCGGGITDVVYYQRIYDWLDGRHIEQKPNIEICPHSIKSKSYKEQKPADLSDMMVHKEPYIAPVPTPMVADEPKPKVECDNETEIQKAFREGKSAGRKEVFDHPEEYGLQQEQKPVEWDDYTKTNLDRALQIIKKAKGNLQGYQSDDGIYECDKAIECLEHFLYRGLEIEKPAEWSEEDEKMRGSIIRVLQRYVARTLPTRPNSCTCSDNVFYTYQTEIDWLKSLPMRCPKSSDNWKPSEEDIKMLEHIIGQYETGNKNSKNMGYLPRTEELSFLKKVLSKWKN